MPDSLHRCAWCGTDPLYVAYHDEEWGVPEYDARALWEKLVLDGFQADEPGRQGLDIGGRMGQPVYAAASGVVVYSGSGLTGYGELVIVKHNDDYLSAYGHNSVRLVKEGQQVVAGQEIAEMGNSGAPRVELHFEIRKDGRPLNPLDFLPKR